MTRQIKYKIVAGVLLLVFSLNTLAGFACSIGIDLGYNSGHHQTHRKQHRSDDKQNTHAHKHKQRSPKTHLVLDSHNSTHSLTINDNQNDCCSGFVTQFARLDKAVPHNDFVLQAPVFVLALTTAFVVQDPKEAELPVDSRFQFVRRSCFLNDTSIRISIQSFLI
jgi:hypothetical protein